MLVARIIEVAVPLFGVGLLMLIGVRFFRGVPDRAERARERDTSAMWSFLGRVFLGVGAYLFLTRFFR